MEPLTRTLVHFSHALKFEDLSGDTVHQTKCLLLDYLGVTIAGTRTESAQAVCRMVLNDTYNLGPGPCTIIGPTARSCPERAALANGTASHSIELDDTHQAGSIHLGVVMFSVAIALSEIHPEVDIKQFITAVVAGYEVAARLAMALQPKLHYELGFHPTATCGVFGAAVTAARILGLSEEQMLWSVGIAGSMAAGSLEFLSDGSWTKRLHPGLAAQNGILAAKLAAEGFRGPASILEGRDGFLSAYSRDAKFHLVNQDLGMTYELLRISTKPHACCRYMQAPIDGLTELAITNDLHPEQISRVEIAVLEAGWPLVCEPRQRKYSPSSIVDAQFSMPFAVALALTYRPASLDQFGDGNLTSAQLQSLMSKVVMVKDQRIEKNFPAEWATHVKVQLTNGNEVEKVVRFPKGDTENPLSWQELTAKCQSLAMRTFPPNRCQEIVDSVNDMDRFTSLSALWKLMAPPTAETARFVVPHRGSGLLTLLRFVIRF